MSMISRMVGFFNQPKQEESDFSACLMLGPICAFCTILVAWRQHANADLVFFAIAGTILCMKSRMKGWVYSSVALVLAAIAKHFLIIESHHLWQAGIEASMLLAFAITAMASDWLDNREKNLLSAIDRKEAMIGHLEEELSKTKKDALDEQISLNTRLADLKKEYEENAAEMSSLRILNDVLRKTTAKSSLESEEKIREAENRADSWKKQSEQSNAQISSWQEKAAFQEQELSQMQSQIDRMTGQIAERDQMIHGLQERLQAISQKEGLYQELRKQFEEKNAVLHQTRVELFQTTTALDALRLEMEHQKASEGSEVEKLLSNEWETVEAEKRNLEAENERLLEIVTQLYNISAVPAVENQLKIPFIETAGEAPPKPVRKRGRKKAAIDSSLLDPSGKSC